MPWAIPPEALPQWRRLAEVLHVEGPAPCEEGDPDAWWPDRAADPLAVRICGGCPAKVECLDYALAADERDGLWGGLTRAERVEVARQRGQAPLSPPAVARHGENSTYAAGCDCRPCTQAHTRYVADWRTRRRYAETTRSA
ncbi:WhiB family transcriptional regulator [Blastococcus sp. HT6-30]|uniref:WhiB family transcriptional regulator n=1 Tax=Blastococcus sp. HT6-30 TaxID=3144843 RepID=UPI00321BE0A7